MDLTSIRQALDTLDEYVRENVGEESEGVNDNSSDALQEKCEAGEDDCMLQVAKRCRVDASVAATAVCDAPMASSSECDATVELAYQQANDLLWQSDDAVGLKALLAQCVSSAAINPAHGTHDLRLNDSRLINYHGLPKGRFVLAFHHWQILIFSLILFSLIGRC
jgi:hypothetical protein